MKETEVKKADKTEDEKRSRQFGGIRYSLTETCLVVITILTVGFVLSKAAQVAIPFLLAFLLALLLSPLMRVGQKYKVPPPITVVIILAALVAVLLPMGILINSRLQGMMDILPNYYTKLVNIGRVLLTQVDIPEDFWVTINWYNTIGRYLSGVTGFMLGWMGTLVMVMVFLIFMLMESVNIEFRIKSAFGGDDGFKIWEICHKIAAHVSKYLRTLAVISAATGICVWIALTLIGVDFAMTWGLVAFFLNFIPTIGSIIASIPPIMIAIVQFFPDWIPALLTLFSLLMIQFTIGNIMTPQIMGDTLDLSPVLILISLLFWSLIWGISGALMSVPIAVVIRIVCENIPKLNFLAVLMSSPKARKD